MGWIDRQTDRRTDGRTGATFNVVFYGGPRNKYENNSYSRTQPTVNHFGLLPSFASQMRFIGLFCLNWKDMLFSN